MLESPRKTKGEGPLSVGLKAIYWKHPVGNSHVYRSKQAHLYMEDPEEYHQWGVKLLRSCIHKTLRSPLLTAVVENVCMVKGTKARLGVQVAGWRGRMTSPECAAFLSMHAACVAAAALLSQA